MSTEAQESYDRQRLAIEGMLADLPETAQKLVRKYRRPLELCGRAGPGGSAEAMVLQFLADVRIAFDEQWEFYSHVSGGAKVIREGAGY